MRAAERRVAPRRERAQDVLVKVLASTAGGDVDGRIYRCATADVSATGMRLRSTVAIADGATLDLRVRTDDALFVMTGFVCWATHESGAYAAGVQFRSAEGDDVDAWSRWISEL